MRRTKEDAEKTRDDILKAATGVFYEKGVARSTLDEIARAAHVTRGAIYWHFKNKAEIFDALYTHLQQPLIDMVAEDLAQNHPDPLAQLRDLCVRLMLDLEDNEQKRQALALFLIKHSYVGELAPYKEKHYQQKAQCMQLFRRYFEKAGHPAPDLPTQAVSCFMKGILLDYLDRPEEFGMKDKAPRLFDLLFGGLAR